MSDKTADFGWLGNHTERLISHEHDAEFGSVAASRVVTPYHAFSDRHVNIRSTGSAAFGRDASPSSGLLGFEYSYEAAPPERHMTYQDRIVRDPKICGGQPVIKGTRVLVRVVLGYLAHGETTAAILSEFPSLTEDDVRAVIAFAAASASEDLPAPSPIPPDVKVA